MMLNIPRLGICQRKKLVQYHICSLALHFERNSPIHANVFGQSSVGQLASASDQQSQSLQGEPEPNFGNSSGPHFSMYSKAAWEEDNETTDRWQRDTN